MIDEDRVFWDKFNLYSTPCMDSRHLPGVMGLVLTAPMKWVCPSCGQVTMIQPNTVTCQS